jgi:hypothetical protein
VLNLGSDVTQIHRVGSLAYMSPEQLDGGTLDCRADIYSLGAVLYHLIAGRPIFDAQVQSAMMHQIYNVKPAPLAGIRAGVTEGLDAVIQQALAKRPGDRYGDWGEFAQALSTLVTTQQVPRGQFQGVLDSERFTLLRTLEFFANFGDVELWEVVHRAKWQRFHFGHALYRKGEEGNTFHIMAQGEVEVFRDGKKVAQLGAGTSVGKTLHRIEESALRAEVEAAGFKLAASADFLRHPEDPRDERVFQPKVPRAGRPHAHAAQNDAIPVNAIVAAHGLDRLEHIRLARPAVAVFHAVQRVEFDELMEAVGAGDHAEVALETADVFILLYRVASVCGFDVNEAVGRKMAINRARKWARKGDGTGSHIKG